MPESTEYAEWQFDSQSEDDTSVLGAHLARILEPGTVVALNGNLGAGKTRLVQAIAAGLGVDRRNVSSPTFILIQEYEGRVPLYHIDTYRLRDSDEFLELGADEILSSDQSICLIEWADRVADVLPADMLTVSIDFTGPLSRRFHFRGSGPRSNNMVRRLQVRGVGE